MKRFKDQPAGSASTPPKEPQISRMEKPPVHTTRYGTQYVRVSDIIESEAGWKSIQQLKDANLILNSSKDERTSSPSSQDGSDIA